MRTTAILGIILMGLGIVCLAYFASPMRLMFQSPMGLPAVNLVPPNVLIIREKMSPALAGSNTPGSKPNARSRPWLSAVVRPVRSWLMP